MLGVALVASSAAAQRTPQPTRPTGRPEPVQSSVAPVTAGPPVVPVDRIVAVVGEQPILFSDVLAFIYARRQPGQELPTDSAQFAALVQRSVNELIDEEVLVQKAKAEKVEVADADLTRSVEQGVKRVRDQFKTEAEYRQALQQNGFGTPEEYRRRQTEELRRQEMQRQVVQKLKRDGKMPLGAVSEAESLLVEVRKGDFEQVAKRESMDPGSKELGGDLGWSRRGQMVPEFERWMFALSPGQISPVIETGHGYHVIKVERVQPGEVKARHILIRPRVDSTDVARARLEADSVLAAWQRGTSYDDLAAKHHDTRAGEERVIPDFPRDELPPSYAAAFAGKQANEHAGPFAIEDRSSGLSKFVVAQLTKVDEGGQYALGDLRQQIRDQLAEERGYRRLIDSLRKSTYVSLRLDDETSDAKR
jgi:peptidyl-prolyl cis-trans isomerase SurA